ncbi:Tar ligand binding domain-containing protein [Aeromonas fluvialis]|uniref:Tar ligand binding domain-containing protein n=1 Tax=Aeromonas fluvialis TaxID=591962 RepID=UPI0006939F38|nr:Tar ligand binding domain-containing protein [Aeromonas fluvialis]
MSAFEPLLAPSKLYHTTKIGGFFERFKSVRVQLKLNIFLIIVAFTFIGYKGITSMQDSGESIGDLYKQGMQHSIRAGKILNELESARSSLLLGFQHNPNNELFEMHNHPLSVHIEASRESIALLHNIVDSEILSSDLDDSERQQINELVNLLDKVTNKGFEPAIAALSEGDYTNSNFILLSQINPLFNDIKTVAQSFLDIQINEGKKSFEASQANIAVYIMLVAIFSGLSMLVIVSSSSFIIKRVNQAVTQLENPRLRRPYLLSDV